MQLSAVIFDLDGTVIDDEDEWGEAFGMVLRRLGVKGVSKHPHIGGIGVEENWPILLKKFKIKTNKDITELARETEKQYKRLVDRITLKKGFRELISELKSSGIKTALATSSYWDIVDKIFNALGIEDCFDSVTTGEEVEYKKPSPQIFEKSAEKLGVASGNSLVFEDSKAGIEAAQAAGMKVVGVFRDAKHKKELLDAQMLIENFDQVTPRLIEDIV